MSRLIGAVIGLILLMPFAVQAQSVTDDLVEHEIIAQTLGVVPGEKHWFAVRQTIARGWHTYWLNAGDAGGPSELSWRANEDLLLSDIFWPTPKIIPYLGLNSHAYEDEAMLLFEVEVPETFQANRLVLDLDIKFLVCEDICIPGEDVARLVLPVVKEHRLSADAEEISKAIQTKPEAAPYNATLLGNELVLSGPGMIEGRVEGLHFIPIDTDVIDHNIEQPLRWVEGKAHLLLAAQKEGGTIPADLGGMLIVSEKIGESESETVSQGVTIALGSSDFENGGAPKLIGADEAQHDFTLNEFWIAIAFAFLGGLILNLMPCVFPVLSLKALALVGSADASAASRRGKAIAYFLGVLVSFALLGVLFLGLREAGASLGWGFQFQSSIFVTLLAILFFAVALNLNGLFEIGGSAQSMGDGLTRRDTKSSSFFTGALATVAATPCTAPFMSAALGYALTQSNGVAFGVIMALGLGFALPMSLISMSNWFAARLPHPGAWMVKLRHILALPLYASVVWLAWILYVQSGSAGLAILVSALIAIGLLLLIFGRVLRASLKALTCVFLLVIAGGAAWSISLQNPILAKGVDLNAAWSSRKVEEHLAQGRNVFVDFTAAWCITCKVNEAAVLNTSAFQAWLELSNTKMLIADWTKQDSRITAELEKFGRAGVPLYLLYKAGEAEPVILPQLLSQGIVEQALSP